MSRKNKKRQGQKLTQMPDTAPMEAFTFGDPIPVLDKREIFDYLECVRVDNYYEPPISFNGLARTFPRRPPS
ncbi:capsid portal protein [Xenorhabdus sp. TS4]|nr:capsid portal protein [Xenorhabdus sp. TS4]